MADAPSIAQDWERSRREGAQLLEARRYADAEALLRPLAPHDPGGECAALLALALFQQQRYPEAAEEYGRALSLVPGSSDWEEMRGLALANAAARVDLDVPGPRPFTRDELLAPPEVPPGTLPSPPPARVPSLQHRILRTLGNGLGYAVSGPLEGVTRLVGLFGYKDEVWTNWYRRGLFRGILTLAYMRVRLNKHNLRSSYPRGSLIGYQDPGLVPPPGASHFRTADGSWNNFANPKEGAAGTRFPRNVADTAIRPETGERLMTPNPRLISRKLLTREREMAEVPFLNLFAAAWIQFENHDWISHGEPISTALHEIPLAADDPARIRYRQSAIYVGKSPPDLSYGAKTESTPITFINEVTHWWDASQIYGSDQKTVDHLRSHEGGKLRLQPDGTLPRDSHGLEESGFTRNWWVGLSLLHTLFANEHNAICDMLAAGHPDWDDNRLFNVARLINAAVTAKIHSVEWTPAILPNETLSEALNANWYGALTNIFRRGKTKKTVSPFNVRNPELGGVVGNPIDKHGVPYGLTQEFVEVYRLHSLLPESLTIRSAKTGETIREVPFPNARMAGSAQLTATLPMADLLASFGVQQPGQLVLNNFPRFMQELSLPGNPLFDMGAIDILRARERGVPRYNEFRRQLGLNPIRTLEDLTKDPDKLSRLREVYGDDVEQIDLLIGTLSESIANRPTHFGFGETMFQMFILNATRRLQADRFYTDCYNEETYTKEGLDWIDRATLKSVLLRHHPELASTGLANIRNAFEPWDTGTLSAERHPLRAFDATIKGDPWRGDAAK